MNQRIVFAVAVMHEGSLLTMDAISREGKLWLVPQWYDYPDEKMSKPARMIRFDNLPHETAPGLLHDYLLQRPLSKDDLYGEASAELEVLEGDQITFGIRTEYLKPLGH